MIVYECIILLLAATVQGGQLEFVSAPKTRQTIISSILATSHLVWIFSKGENGTPNTDIYGGPLNGRERLLPEVLQWYGA
jgi:hypothetical protein